MTAAMIAGKITAFFRPFAGQNTSSSKRPLSQDNNPEDLQRRSKSPKISEQSISPLPIRTDSPNAKRIGPPLTVSQRGGCRNTSSDLSPLPSDSDLEDTIVVQAPQRPRVKDKVPSQVTSELESNQSFVSSTSTSSHRIEKYGQTVITGSDDSDSDSLLDLDDLLGRRAVPNRSVEGQQQTKRVLRKTSGRSLRSKYVDTTKADAALFSNLMRKAHSDVQNNQDSKAATRLVDELDVGSSNLLDTAKSNETRKNITVESIISRLGDTDPDGTERFTQAIERTELTHTSYQWSFFENPLQKPSILNPTSDEVGDPSIRSQDAKRPESCSAHCEAHCQPATVSLSTDSKSNAGSGNIVVKCKACQESDSEMMTGNSRTQRSTDFMNSAWPELKNQPGWALYQDRTHREMALIGGAFQQAAIDNQLPDELYFWIMQQSFCEPSEYLKQAYQRILDLDRKPIKSSQALRMCRSGLMELGASEEAMHSSDPILKQPVHSPDIKLLTGIREDLTTWLRNIEHITHYMNSLDRARLLEHLFILTLDSTITSNASILAELQHALDICIDSFEDNDADNTAILGSVQRLFHRAGDAHFRLRCIAVLPISSQKPSQLRRRLALATFYEDPSHLEHNPDSRLLQSVRQHLMSHKQFQMTSKTDYKKLVALFSCLDIAIGDGNAPETSDTTTIQIFNETLDELANTLQSKYARIQAHGAAHISRTQTKDVLEAIERRLRYSVRTRPKPKANPFKQRTLDNIIGNQKNELIESPHERASMVI